MVGGVVLFIELLHPTSGRPYFCLWYRVVAVLAEVHSPRHLPPLKYASLLVVKQYTSGDTLPRSIRPAQAISHAATRTQPLQTSITETSRMRILSSKRDRSVIVFTPIRHVTPQAASKTFKYTISPPPEHNPFPLSIFIRRTELQFSTFLRIKIHSFTILHHSPLKGWFVTPYPRTFANIFRKATQAITKAFEIQRTT